MSDKLKLNRAIDEAVKADATNSASVEATTEQVEVTHTADSWSVAGFVRKRFGRKGVEAGVRAEKSWQALARGRDLEPHRRRRGRAVVMGQSTFCARCGLEAPLDGAVKPCSGCGWIVFVPARYLDWDASLSEGDRKMLKSLKISIT